ncbi:glutathione S-transferase 2-like isoform X1 [Pollicipes pollicipes]|uniref:glutathione S-transferase 2-like isoform X1 n=1 Tax=Pollicipes pollicipes TaxID=41117 RepID=UPI0018850594|nr:glutathione S-transferase 2-like isoform X1 [Pollicipes pollicipes]
MPSVFGYWTIRGLGQVCRFMLEYTGEEYQDDRYDATNPEKWQEVKTKNPHGLAFPNLPYYVDGDVKMSQSAAIIRHLARKNDMVGTSDHETRQLEMLEGVIWDLRVWLAFLCYGTEESFNQTLPAMKERVSNCFKQLSDYLGSNKWFLGDRITYVDFLFYDVFTNWHDLDSHLLDATENLRTFRQRFEALPAIKSYMTSDRFIKWPINLPSAFWGGK